MHSLVMPAANPGEDSVFEIPIYKHKVNHVTEMLGSRLDYS
jgi:hypothetical protein